MTADFGATGAAILYASGAVMLFGVRSWRHHRATGDAGFRGFTPHRGMAARIAGLCFALAVIGGLLSPVLVRLDVLPLVGRAENWSIAGWGVWLGLAISAIGFGLAVIAQTAMGASWRIGVDESERTSLVIEGVFALVRNPIFTAMVIAQVGTALMAPTWLSLVGAALLVAGVELQVRLVEEPYLHRVHGTAYARYAARTGRFLPRVGRLAHTAEQPWRQKVSR